MHCSNIKFYTLATVPSVSQTQLSLPLLDKTTPFSLAVINPSTSTTFSEPVAPEGEEEEEGANELELAIERNWNELEEGEMR